MFFYVSILLTTIPFVYGGNNTITDEVFFDVKIDSDDPWSGRFVVGVFGDILPMTTFNFINLAKGYRHKEETWHYKNCMIHRIVPDFLIQTGDVIYKDGRGGRSVYAPFFIDESFHHSHMATGFVAMANVGPDSNGSQFYITLTRARWLDGRNVVFGKVVKGMNVINRLSKLDVDLQGAPRVSVYITNSGRIPLKEPYDLSEDDLSKNGDIFNSEQETAEFVEL